MNSSENETESVLTGQRGLLKRANLVIKQAKNLVIVISIMSDNKEFDNKAIVTIDQRNIGELLSRQTVHAGAV